MTEATASTVSQTLREAPRPLRREVNKVDKNSGLREQTSQLRRKVKKWLPFWQEEVKTQPEAVVNQIAEASDDLEDSPPISDGIHRTGNQDIDSLGKEINLRWISLPDKPSSGRGLSLRQIKELYGERNYWENIRKLYGREIARGSTCQVFLDSQRGVITKLFEQNLDRKQVDANSRQMQIYQENSGKHPFFTFLQEVPGGWQQTYFPNDGNLRDYLRNGGKLRPGELDQFVHDYEAMAQISQRAHGDIVKTSEGLDDWQRELLRKNLEAMQETGFINHEQVLVGKPDENGSRRLIILDWAGGGDPFPLNGVYNPEDPRFLQAEIKGVKSGVEIIKKRLFQD